MKKTGETNGDESRPFQKTMTEQGRVQNSCRRLESMLKIYESPVNLPSLAWNFFFHGFEKSIRMKTLFIQNLRKATEKLKLENDQN